MKTVTKLLMGAAALAATAGAAHAANTTLPSTDNSNLMFFVNDATAHSTYTVVLSQQINSAGGYFTNADALSSTTQGSLNTIYGNTNFSYNFASDTALQSFISGANTSGDTLQWGIIGGAYTGVSPTARQTQGAVLAVATSTDSASVVSVGESGIDGAIPANLNTDAGHINSKTLDSFNGTPQGIFGTASSAGGTNLTLYGNGVNMHGTVIGSSYGLYGLTTNGGSGGTDIAYNLGTASFNGTALVFTGNTPLATPLPAAAWLFGSGLLGLLGIGRRRDGAVAAA